MTPIERYFDGHIFCINLAHRTDRWAHVQEQLKRLGITTCKRFEAYANVRDHTGKVNGNCGCTASHRALLEIVAYEGWPRVLILEDDFHVLHEDCQSRFEAMIKDVPENWDMLYLGAHYGERPLGRVSPHVIRAGAILTTSSYAVTASSARKIAPYIGGVGPIDSLYGEFNRTLNTYVFQPRLMVQYASFSDLTERHSTNEHCMQDTAHENMV